MCNTTIAQRLSNRKIMVDILALMFGLGAWIGVNGIYVQLPLLIRTAPENWGLSAHLVIIVQFANLGPILYTLYAKISKWKGDHYIISILLATGTIAVYILAWSYDKTVNIFGEEHSVPLLGLMFVVSVIGCTSSVLFMPYMRNYREIYLVSYLVGEGLSGFLPSLVALIQGVGGNAECRNVSIPGSNTYKWEPYYPDPRFPPTIYFAFVGTVLLLSFLSFVSLNISPTARQERVKLPSSTETLPTEMNAPPSYKTSSGWSMSNKTYSYLLIMMAIICFLGNGILPSIQSFSCLPYGNIAYHLTVTLASMAGPLAMCLSFVIKTPRISFLTFLMSIVIVLSVIVFSFAIQSPEPPLKDSLLGQFIIVMLWILINGLSGFIRIAITTIFRLDPGKGLYYTGVATQVGSLIGATVSFVLVSYTHLFKSKECPH